MRGHAPHGGRNPLVDIGRRLFRIFIVGENRRAERREVRHGENGVSALFVDDLPVVGVLLHLFDFNVSNGRRRGHDELFFQRRDLVVSLLRHLLLGFLVLFERFDLFLELFGFLFELLVVGLRLGVLGTDDVDGDAQVFRRGTLELPEDFLFRVLVHVLDGLADFAGVPHGKAKVADFRQAFLAERGVIAKVLINSLPRKSHRFTEFFKRLRLVDVAALIRKAPALVFAAGLHDRKPLDDGEAEPRSRSLKALNAAHLLLKCEIAGVVFRMNGDGAGANGLKFLYRIGLFGNGGGGNGEFFGGDGGVVHRGLLILFVGVEYGFGFDAPAGDFARSLVADNDDFLVRKLSTLGVVFRSTLRAVAFRRVGVLPIDIGKIIAHFPLTDALVFGNLSHIAHPNIR